MQAEPRQVFAGVNRAKYDLALRSSRWAIERDRQLDRLNIALVQAGLGCCHVSAEKRACSCETQPVGETFMPVGLRVQNDPFAAFK